MRHFVLKSIHATIAIATTLTCLLTALPQQAVGASPVPDDAKVVINIPSRTLTLFHGEKAVKTYPVGVGRVGYITPIGKFKVLRKVVDPGWEHPYKPAGEVRIPPGKDNPLGTRWIGFKQLPTGEFGIHGTDRPQSVGKFSSHGCVRMKIADAEELFDRVQLGTPVEVTYDLVRIRPQGTSIELTVYPDVFKRGKPTAAAVLSRIQERFPAAWINQERIKAALQQPNEKPIFIGAIDVPPALPMAPADQTVISTGEDNNP